MNLYFVAAAALAVITGSVHSILGEILIFRRMREGKILDESHVRILWASWHLMTVMGLGFASIILWLALPSEIPRDTFIELAIIVVMMVSSALVLIATRARHPGWIALLGVSILIWLGRT